MNWFDKRPFFRFLSALPVVIAAAGIALCPADALAKEKKKKKDKDKDKENDIVSLIPIPVGHGGGGIKIPQHDENGRLQMTFEIGSAFREDEVNLRMENLKIETFDALGNLDMVVEMPKSIMNLKTRVLTSVDPIQIERTDFKIIGGNVTFNTQTRYGTFKGPVRMLIFNRNEL